MAFDSKGRPEGRNGGGDGKRTAVIGSGVAGLSAAWLLSKSRDVIVYEADRRLGGHANTVVARLPSGATPIDAGFIVYNEPAYPNLTALFDHLGVASEETCMSFGVSTDGGRCVYSGQSLSSVFADRKNIFSPSFIGMLLDVARFHRDARKGLRNGLSSRQTLAEFIQSHGYGQRFRRDFIKPMAAAIWSTPSTRVLDFAADAFIKFYANHGLLQTLNLPTWRTVSGGSRNYVDRISAPFASKARLSTPVERVSRVANGVEVRDARGGVEVFGDVVIATHADAALSMLGAPTADERRILGAFKYHKNNAVMHMDETLMPERRKVWSSWNYVGGDDAPSVSYWMNRLQNLRCPENVFVTLNPARRPRIDTVIAEFDYDHPVFDLGAASAQREIWSLQGNGGVWYCGAHFGQGFHEDGLQSGLAAAEAIGGMRRPWSVENESGRIHLTPCIETAA